MTINPPGMVLIPAGTFQMGSDDANASDDEQPVHPVHLEAFFMDIYPVTNEQYREFLNANPEWRKDGIDSKFHAGNYLLPWDGFGYPPGKANHPVTYVSWYAALAYAISKGKRLPTEAEWEYAARGGLAGQTYPWGNDISPYRANYEGHLGNTTAVGQYSANGYGLYDMAGNVREWCFDLYRASFYAGSQDSRNPICGSHPLQKLADLSSLAFSYGPRVSRGGSWKGSPGNLRVANRYRNKPIYASSHLGFRCVELVAPRLLTI